MTMFVLVQNRRGRRFWRTRSLEIFLRWREKFWNWGTISRLISLILSWKDLTILKSNPKLLNSVVFLSNSPSVFFQSFCYLLRICQESDSLLFLFRTERTSFSEVWFRHCIEASVPDILWWKYCTCNWKSRHWYWTPQTFYRRSDQTNSRISSKRFQLSIQSLIFCLSWIYSNLIIKIQNETTVDRILLIIVW